MINKSFCVKAVLFDFDGTLTEPGSLDFLHLKETMGCPPDAPILEFIEDLPTQSQRNDATMVLERFELEAAVNSKPNQGAEDVIFYLQSKKIPLGIITRNSLTSIKRAFHNFEKIDISDFDIIISRDTPVKPKPSGDGILLAAQTLKVNVKDMIIVGDYIFDIQAGQAAGSTSVFIDHGTSSGSPTIKSDFTIFSLNEIKKIVRLGLPLPMGKLPNDILEQFLDRLNFQDPSVLINAGVGEDTAAVNIEPEEILVLKSDPITFVTDSIGLYAVLINANDIATSGATPRWLLTTLLFPEGITASGIWQVMHELESVCRLRNIALCGGHTEITDAVTRPVVTGMLVGTVTKCDLIDKRDMKPGDRVLLTKAVAVEGTAIIATEFEKKLIELGMTEIEIEQCCQFISSISILEEAKIAGRSKGVHAMHDVTEGGLSTALKELSIAGGHEIRVNMDRIPILPQTEKVCQLLGIHPLGLIGSGSLLICCQKDETDRLLAGIREAGIDVTCIGEVLDAGRGIEAVNKDGPTNFPAFEADEITRLFNQEIA